MALEKTTRAELIAALVTDKFSGFKDGDESILEAASDARLEEFSTRAAEAKASSGNFGKLENEHRNLAARLKVAEDRLKAAEEDLSEEDFLRRAPASIKELVSTHRAEEASIQAALITRLKDLGAHTEDELKKKSIAELKTLATYARVPTPDFSGRGFPIDRATAQKPANYAPPDPYKEGLDKLRAKVKN